ncbi:MAG: HNH endonuclease signature motif containing protein [Solirubrobacteraceae bacterium]|nr:HNH endonuclease signature motif containing protein [Solirubrobacteraceae bacterium]
METKTCIICKKEIEYWGQKKVDTEVCRHCIRRVKTWGYNGATELMKLAENNIDISILDAEKFCDMYYVGKVTKGFEKIEVMKNALKSLNSKSRIIGRKRKFSDYAHKRAANIGWNQRHEIRKNKCELCDSTENLHLHHIVPVSWGGAEYFPNEVITLCNNCHLSVHARLAKLLNNEYFIQLISPHVNEIYKKCRSVLL